MKKMTHIITYCLLNNIEYTNSKKISAIIIKIFNCVTKSCTRHDKISIYYYDLMIVLFFVIAQKYWLIYEA